MDEGTADDLYRRLKKTDASARQKLGLGFEARHSENCQQSICGSKGKKPGRAARPDKVDYATKIRGYDRMSTFEKLKAKTKFDLSSAFKGDEAGPDELGRQWTRFVFNNDAPLEEEGARPDTKFGRDDDGLAELNSVSFRTSNAQSHIDNQSARHEDAIFSASVKAEALADDTGGAREGVQPSIIRACGFLAPSLLCLTPGLGERAAPGRAEAGE
eukprot:jgi/Tetstr1/453558/TSEL_040526.t1